MRKTALVISGGGSKGAFAVGAIKFLKEQMPEIEFDIFVGTSTGSLIVPMAATGKIDLLEEMYTSVHTEDIVLGGNLGARLTQSVSLFDATPLSKLIKRFYNDEISTEILNLEKQIFLATTCLQTSTGVIFSTKEPPEDSEYEIVKLTNNSEFRRAIMASACQPVFMQPIEVHQGAVPLKQYVDGGVREYIGIQIAIDAGAEEIFAISLSPQGDDVEAKNFTKAIDILFKTIDIFSSDVSSNDLKIPQVYNKALRYIAAVKKKMKDSGMAQATIDDFFDVPFHEMFVGKKPLRINHIFPEEPLGGGPGGLTFDPIAMKGMIAKGETRMQEFIANLPPDDGDVA